MMRRTAADRRAEAARAQQMTEQAQKRVQDRKTGEFYNPQERFDTIMNKPEILAMLKRLAVR
jgi:hypothetical protein